VTYCDTVVERGRMTIDQFAPQISFFFYTHGDFFEEIAKYRAGRRRWATIVRERWGAKSDKAAMFRFGCVSVARRCTRRRRRTTWSGWPTRPWRRCSAACSRCSPPPGTSPSPCPAKNPPRSRCAPADPGLRDRGHRVADPLGGSYFVEALTDATEERIIEIMADLENHGGMVRCIEDGYLQGLIADEAYKIHLAEESGERVVVGLNKFVSDEPPPDISTYELDAEGRETQLKRFAGQGRTRQRRRRGQTVAPSRAGEAPTI
jgi:methylmalonyl-CoA mutase N-terminal domain/subunit